MSRSYKTPSAVTLGQLAQALKAGGIGDAAKIDRAVNVLGSLALGLGLVELLGIGQEPDDVDDEPEPEAPPVKPARAADWRRLGLDPDATFAEAKRAYRRAAREAHPDRGGSDKRMAALNASWARVRATFDP